LSENRPSLAEKDGGINVTTYLEAFMDLEMVVRFSIQGKKKAGERIIGLL